jgi:two-component system NarL family sensor kinase
VSDQLVFSIARELITNASRHAGATALTVSVHRDAGAVTLEVADDGSGIAPGRLEEAPLSGHIGLASCAERVEALDGRFEIEPNGARGTRVRAVIPAPVPVSS